MIRNIIFDWSGTLVDDLPAVWKATNHVFQKAGLQEITLEKFRAEFCLPFKAFYDRFTPHIPMAQLEERYHAHFKQVEDSVTELPHAREFLEVCRDRGIRTFLLSTIHRDHFIRQAARTGFDQYLDRTYVEALDKRARVIEVTTDNQLRPDETLFIGDMQHDIETAKHAGIYSCAVLTGFSCMEQLRASQPDMIVEHLGELRRVLDQNHWEVKSTNAAAIQLYDSIPISTVGALIYNEKNDVLMVRTHKWSNLWGIPGGKIKLGERAVDALRREIKEETNLEVKDVRFIMVQDCVFSREFYRDAHFVLLNYTARCCGEAEIQLNHEAQEFRWMNPVEALSLALNQPTRDLICAVEKSSAGRGQGLDDTITLCDLEVFYHVGVPEEERLVPQRLLLTIELTQSFTQAAIADALGETIDYFALKQCLIRYGEGRRWKLIETLAVHLAEMILAEFGPRKVCVEVKKFIIPETRYVAVRVSRSGC